MIFCFACNEDITNQHHVVTTFALPRPIFAYNPDMDISKLTRKQKTIAYHKSCESDACWLMSVLYFMKDDK